MFWVFMIIFTYTLLEKLQENEKEKTNNWKTLYMSMLFPITLAYLIGGIFLMIENNNLKEKK